jgi:kynurenine formamidase
MEIFDISVPIRPGMITYPGDPEVHVERVVSIEHGDVANLTRLDFGVHTGTHVDAPVHFIDGGTGADALPLEVFLGPCEVVDATAANEEVGPELVPSHVERVLFKTRNSELWERDSFDEGFTQSAWRPLSASSRTACGSSGSTTSRSAIRKRTRRCSEPGSQRWRASTYEVWSRVSTHWPASHCGSSTRTAPPLERS